MKIAPRTQFHVERPCRGLLRDYEHSDGPFWSTSLKYDTRFLLRYKPRRGPRWQNVVQHFQFNFLFARQKTESLQHRNIFSTSILFDLKLNVISWTPEGPSVEVGSAQPSQPSHQHYPISGWRGAEEKLPAYLKAEVAWVQYLQVIFPPARISTEIGVNSI